MIRDSSAERFSPAAIRYTGPFQLPRNGTVKARVLDGQSWSALDEATFAIDVVPADASNLRIAEVHYHPACADGSRNRGRFRRRR